MSLAVEGERRRAHSRSGSRDRRPRDEDPRERNAPTYGDVREPSYVYPEDDLDDRYQPSRYREPSHSGSGLPYPSAGDMGGLLPERHSSYSQDDVRPIYRTASPNAGSSYRGSKEQLDSLPGAFPDDGPSIRGGGDSRRARFAETEEPDKNRSRGDRQGDNQPLVRYASPSRDKYSTRDNDANDKLKYLPQKYSRRYDDDEGDDNAKSKHKNGKKDRSKKDRVEEDLAYGYAPPPRSPRPESPPTYGTYIPASRDDKRSSKYGYEEEDRYDYDRKSAYYDDKTRDKRSSKYDDRDYQSEKRYSKYEDRDDRDDRGEKRPSKYEDRDDRSEKRSSKYDDRDDRGEKRSSKYDDRDDRNEKRSSKYDERDYQSEKRSSKRHEKEETNGKKSSKHRDDDDDDARRSEVGPDENRSRRSHRDSYRDDPRSSGANVLTVDPSSRDRDRSRDRRRDKSPGPAPLAIEAPPTDRRRDKSPGPSILTVEPGSRDRDRSRDRRGSGRDKSPQPPTARMSSLTVSDPRVAATAMTLAAAPGSPLLESYHGTYQDCSPMPSPLLLASQNPNDDPRVMDALAQLNSEVEGDSKKKSRRARFHDPEDIASQLARALKGDRPPDVHPLVAILPSLTHEQVMELRVDYKKIVKTGSERKGVNIAKHIRARLKDEDSNLMKACYSVALGMWESEAYWANFWYQGDKTRRELLIESLMGRTNGEIRQIKDAFTDKKYSNSLTKCMKTELKEDKFKKAVLVVLDESRMEDYDHHGRRIPIDYNLVDRDVSELHKAVRAEKGGESLMISIIVQRSDDHLRAILKEYEHHYRSNFAREALHKSGNLVGELLAHILNGVINRPVRDALLLHHALTASRKDNLRRELLISRLVRFHWDAVHMQAVKRAYLERYGHHLQDAVREATSGHWGQFCSELCIARMPDDVRKLY